MELIYSLKDPAVVASMPLGDKLMAGLLVSAIGMTITFIGLIFLWGMIVLMTKLLVRKPKDSPVVVAPEKTIALEKAATSLTASSTTDSEIDEELVAVITAAIAASMRTGIHNIVVKNIVRVPDETPAWAKNGRLNQMNTRF